MVCGAALIGGCGGAKSSHGSGFPNSGPGVASSLEAADCSDWKRGSIDQRRREVVLLRDFLGGQVGSSQGIQRGRVLDDPQAYTLLDGQCAADFARGFKLYKLYARAAAFVGHAPGR